MLVFNNQCSITCQSCCCTMSRVDHFQKAVAVECTHFMSHKCLCKLPTCSRVVDHLRETVASRESCHQSSQSQEGASIVHTRDLPLVSGSTSSPSQCSCSTDSQLMSTTHRTACVCRRVSKPLENLAHFVRRGQSVSDVRADPSCTQQCCARVRDLGKSSCHHGVMLSDVSAGLCPHCSKFAQVNRREERNSRLTSRHSDTDLYGIQEEHEKTVSNSTHVQTGSVIICLLYTSPSPRDS